MRAENLRFNKIIELIYSARENALRKVNEELIILYWNVGNGDIRVCTRK